MAKFAEPPTEPAAPMEGPQAPEEPRQIPPEGVTAGDLAIQQKVAQAPDPQKDPIRYIEYVMVAGFESIHKRLNQQGELVAAMAEKVYGPAQAAQAPGQKQDPFAMIFSPENISKALDIAKSQFTQTDPRDQRALEIGYKILNGAEDRALKIIYGDVGKQTANSITHVG